MGDNKPIVNDTSNKALFKLKYASYSIRRGYWKGMLFKRSMKNLEQKSLLKERINSLTPLVYNRENILKAFEQVKSFKRFKYYDIQLKDLNEVNIVEMVRDNLDDFNKKHFIKINFEKDNKKELISLIDLISQQAVYNILEPVIKAQIIPTNFSLYYTGKIKAMAKSASYIHNSDYYSIAKIELNEVEKNIDLDVLISKLENEYNIKDRKFLRIIKRLMKIDVIINRTNVGRTKHFSYNKGLINTFPLNELLMNVYLNELDQMIQNFPEDLRRTTFPGYKFDKITKKEYDETFYHNWRKGRILSNYVRYKNTMFLIVPTNMELNEGLNRIKKCLNGNGIEIKNIETYRKNPYKIDPNGIVRFELLGYKLNHMTPNKQGFYISVANQNEVWKNHKMKLELMMRRNRPDQFVNVIIEFMKEYRCCSNISWFIENINQMLYFKAYKKHRFPMFANRVTVDGNNRYYLNPNKENIKVDLWDLWNKYKKSFSYINRVSKRNDK